MLTASILLFYDHLRTNRPSSSRQNDPNIAGTSAYQPFDPRSLYLYSIKAILHSGNRFHSAAAVSPVPPLYREVVSLLQCADNVLMFAASGALRHYLPPYWPYPAAEAPTAAVLPDAPRCNASELLSRFLRYSIFSTLTSPSMS